MPNERITGTDTIQDIVVKMSEGNPGAISVMVQLIESSPIVDPQALMGGLGSLLSLDTLNIYGSRIWMLYKDVCGQDIAKTIGLLRAWQLGIVTQSNLNHAIDNYGEGIDVDDTLSKVVEQLPEFKLQ
jgi:hypothetical protein